MNAIRSCGFDGACFGLSRSRQRYPHGERFGRPKCRSNAADAEAFPPRSGDPSRSVIADIAVTAFDWRVDTPTSERDVTKGNIAMPLVRIDLVRGKPAAFRKQIGEIVYTAMREAINVPADDKFQVITEHDSGELNVAYSYLGNSYTGDIILIQITLNAGRTVEMKKSLFKRIADDLHDQLKVRREDVVVNLVEVAKENWSFGGGVAQYAN
jgi:phenylpyruvate tautomerase PptA (4-oxalocrotonate tautomerase family)